MDSKKSNKIPSKCNFKIEYDLLLSLRKKVWKLNKEFGDGLNREGDRLRYNGFRTDRR